MLNILLNAGTTAESAPINPIFSFLPFIVMILVFYFFILRPDKKRRKEYSNMLDQVKVNDKVVTRGGLIGRIIKIKDEDLVLESGPDRVRFELKKNSILSVESDLKEEK